jgi:hypothetical protein
VKDITEFLQKQIRGMKISAGVILLEPGEDNIRPVVEEEAPKPKRRTNGWEKRTPKQKREWKKAILEGKKRAEQYKSQEEKTENFSKAAKFSWSKLTPQQRAARIRKTNATRAYKKSLQQPTTAEVNHVAES